MIIKSYIVEKNIHNLEKYTHLLFYGENLGLINDFKDKITKQNKTEIINIFQEDLIKNKELLFNEMSNTSLFDSSKTICLHEISDKVFEQIEKCINLESKDIKLIIISGLLDKRSKLRALFEKKNELGIIACYPDDEKTLFNYISLKLRDFKGLNSEIINLIIQNSKLNRSKVQNEIDKITKLYSSDKKLNYEEIEELINFRTSESFEKLRDATLLGQKIRTNNLLSDTHFMEENNFYYLNQLTYRLNKLMEAQSINENNNIEMAVENLKPKVFWKDKKVIIEQLKKWNTDKLNNAIAKSLETEISMKSSAARSDLLLKNLILNLCLEANASL